VDRVGKEVTGIKVDDRVSGEGHITCGYCRNCRAGKRHLCRNAVGVGVNRSGAFAEYLSIPAVNAFHLPDKIENEIGAILDPFGNAAHTALSFSLVGTLGKAFGVNGGSVTGSTALIEYLRESAIPSV